MARLCAQQEAHCRGAVGESGGNDLKTDLSDFVDRDRQDVRGQAVAEAGKRVDQRHAVRVVVDEDERPPSSRFAIRGQQRAQLAHQGIRRRQRIGGGAGGANGGALSAARTDIGVDGDVIAGGRDRAGRAEVEAARAADDVRARMGAEVRGEGDVAWLVEAAHEVARAEHRLEHGCRVGGIGTQIAVAQIGCGKQRRAARDVEHEVAARYRAVARRSEAQCAARGRGGLRVAIDRELERTEMARGRADRPFHHREIGHPRRGHLGGRPDQHRHVEMILEQIAGLDCLLVAAIDQDHAFAVEADEGNIRRGLGGGREQCRHFGSRRVGVLRPPGGLANVDVADVGAAGLCQFREQRCFLRAAHDQRRFARGRCAEFFEFRPAELARGQDIGAATAAFHRGAVERHRVLARADQDVWRPIGHFVSEIDLVSLYIKL